MVPEWLVAICLFWGRVYGVPAGLLQAQVWRESGYDPYAVGSSGELGLAQFMPETWAEWGDGDPRDPVAAVRAQARYLAWLRSEMAKSGRDSWAWSLLAYNWGVGRAKAVAGWEDVPGERCQYVLDILEKWGSEDG